MMVLTKSKMANRYSPEVRARAVQMVFDHPGSYETQAGAIAAIGGSLTPLFFYEILADNQFVDAVRRLIGL